MSEHDDERVQVPPRRFSYSAVDRSASTSSPPPSDLGSSAHPSLPYTSSLPHLYQLPRPNVSGLRAALLGYLGEVEAALREKLGAQVPVADQLGEVSSNSASSPPSTDTEDEGQGVSTALRGVDGGLRSRGTTSSASTSYAGPSTAPVSSYIADTNLSLLNHLSSLREDVLAYLPHRLTIPSVPRPPGLNRESPSLDTAGGGQEGCALGMDEGAIDGARKRVIELVHALLPSEDWLGWERLGWEEQEEQRDAQGLSPRMSDSHTFSNGRYGVIARSYDDAEDEPEYLFPNRTPASAQAMASRRRTVRSKSLGSVQTRSWIGGGPAYALSSGLHRVMTGPANMGTRRQSFPFLGFTPSGSPAVTDEAGSEVGEGVEGDWAERKDAGVEVDAEDIVEDPDVTDTKLTAMAAPLGQGPTISDTLVKSEDGKKLVTYDDLPSWWKNNEHIITG
jgi:adiponectin receptor